MPRTSADLIAVTGATGAVGGGVAARLADAGVPQRLVVRDARRAPALAGADVRVAAGYGARDEMATALAGARTLLLIPGAEARDRVAQHETAIDAAVDAGVDRIVYVSFLGAAPDATFVLAREHFATEQHVRSRGVAWTFLRMSMFLDFMPGLVSADGVLRGPAGGGRVAPVLRDDVAACAAAVLTSGGHDGRTYDLTGPRALSLAEAAAVMAAASGTSITYVDETDEEALASREGLGADWEVRAWISSYQAIRDGSMDVLSPHVRELTGRDPVSLESWLAEHPQALDHVRPRVTGAD